MMLEFRCPSKENAVERLIDIVKSKNYKRAYQFGDAEEQAELDDLLQAIQDRKRQLEEE